MLLEFKIRVLEFVFSCYWEKLCFYFTLKKMIRDGSFFFALRSLIALDIFIPSSQTELVDVDHRQFNTNIYSS